LPEGVVEGSAASLGQPGWERKQRSYWIAAVTFVQAAMSGLFAALRVLQEADRSVGNVAALRAVPQ